MANITPPYPIPHVSKSSLLRRFFRGWESWIHVLFEKSYTMKMGEIHLPAISVYIANEQPLIDKILNDRDDIFPKHKFLYQMLEPLVGDSVFSVNGDDWREQREMINPSFSHTGMHQAFSAMSDAVTDLIDKISNIDTGKAINVDPLMTHVAGDIIYRTLFSRSLDDESANRIYVAFNQYQRHAQSMSTLRLYGFPTFGFAGRARRAANRINAVFAPIVIERLSASKSDKNSIESDILQSLIEARHPQTGRRFSEAELMQQISTIFLAGHESSASAMSWSLYLLAACPEVQDEVRAEVDAAFDMNDVLTFESLKRLTKTRNVFREALRLYPPVSFLLREVTCPTQMRDKDMRKGSMLVVSPWLVHRNSGNWHDPHAFIPERFETPDGQAACRHAFIPFGKGPRICVGAGFAQQEALLVLAEIVRRFKIHNPPGDAPEPISRLTLRAKNGVRLSFTVRDAKPTCSEN